MGCDEKRYLAAKHTEIFTERVEKVAEGLYIAIGFGLANSILIEGDDGVIVDTMESMEAGERVRAAFREVTTKPVKAIVYTHNHADHIFGAEAFVDDAPPLVLAHATTEKYIDKIINIMRPIIFTRSMRQVGSLMPKEAVENCGIGPELLVNRDTKPGLLRPTKTFDGDKIVSPSVALRWSLSLRQVRRLTRSSCGCQSTRLYYPVTTSIGLFRSLCDSGYLVS